MNRRAGCCFGGRFAVANQADTGLSWPLLIGLLHLVESLGLRAVFVNATLLFALCHCRCQRELDMFTSCLQLAGALAGCGRCRAHQWLSRSCPVRLNIYIYFFWRRCQRSGENVECKLHQSYTCGEASSAVFPPLTFVDSNSDRQPRLNLGAHSIMLPALYFVWFRYRQSQWIIRRRRPWAPSNRMRRLPVNSGAFKLPKSQESFFCLGRQQTLPSSSASLTLLHRRVILFCVVIMRDAPRGGSSRVFPCAYWAKNPICILVSQVIQTIPLRVQVPPVFSKSRHLWSSLLYTWSKVHYVTLLCASKI